MDKLRVVNGNGPAESSLMELAKRLRLFENVGLDVEFVTFNDGRQGVQALLDGRGDVALQIGFGPALAAAESGAKIKVLAGANLRAVHVVFTNVPGVKSVRDLEGRTVGIGSSGALTHQLMTAIIRKQGGDPSKVKWVHVGNSHAVFKAVAARTVDAGLGEVDNMHQQEEFKIHALPDGNLWDQLPEFTNQASYTLQGTIERKRDLLVRALAASARLYRWCCGGGSWDFFFAARMAALPDLDPKEADNQWKFYQERKPFAVDLVIGEDRVRYMQELNVAMGLQKKVLPYAEVADMSLARDALKLIGDKA